MRHAYNADRYHRKSVRLAGFDYSARSAYFVTVRTAAEMPPLSVVLRNGGLRLTDAGRVISREWSRLEGRFSLTVDQFIVMPDHFHGILILQTTRHEMTDDATANSLGRVMQAFKSLSTREYSFGVRQYGFAPFNAKIWQRNYNDHIIGSSDELNNIRRYIRDNPRRWVEQGKPTE